MDGGAWWAALHGVAKSRTLLSDFTFTFHFHALEKEMATHSRILAWRIPGTAEPGGLPIYGVAQSWTRLKRFSSNSRSLWLTPASQSIPISSKQVLLTSSYGVCVLLCTVAQFCLTLCKPMDCSLPCSFVQGFFLALL